MPNLFIDIEARFAKFQDDMTRVRRTVEGGFNGIAGAAGKLRGVLGGLGGVLGGLTLGNSVRAIFTAAANAERSVIRLDALYKNLGDSASVSRERVEQLAQSLATTTQFDDDAVRDASAELLKFGNIASTVFEDALKSAAGLAAFQETDLRDAAQKIAKAYAEPEAAFRLLKDAGVAFTDSQKRALIELGKTQGILAQQEVISARLIKTFGGLEEAMNSGLGSAANNVAKQWNEMLEAIGGSGAFSAPAKTALSGIATVLESITRSITRISAAPDLKRFAPDIGKSAQELEKFQKQLQAIQAQEGGELARIILPGQEPEPDQPNRKAASDARSLLQARLSLSKAQADAQIEVERDAARRSLEIVKENFDDRLTSAKEFAAAQLRITTDLIDAELASLQDQQVQLGISLASAPEARDQLAIRADLARVEADIAIKAAQRADAQRQADRAATDSARTLLDVRREIERQLASAQGQIVADIDTQALDDALRKFREAGDFQTVATIDLLISTQKADAQIATFERDFQALRERLSTGEARIQIGVDTGNLNAPQAEQALLDLRRSQVPVLDDLVARAQAYATANNNAITPEMLARIEQLKLAQEELRASTDETAVRYRKLQDEASSALSGIGRTIVESLRTGKASFADFFENIAFDFLARQVERVLQDILTSVLQTIAAAQAAASAATATTVVTGSFSLTKSAMGNVMTPSGPMPLRKYARGGIATQPQLALFGEGAQNEAFVPLPDGRRIPVALEGAGGGMTVTMNITTPEIGTRKSQTQLLNEVTNAMAAAQRRR